MCYGFLPGLFGCFRVFGMCALAYSGVFVGISVCSACFLWMFWVVLDVFQMFRSGSWCVLIPPGVFWFALGCSWCFFVYWVAGFSCVSLFLLMLFLVFPLSVLGRCWVVDAGCLPACCRLFLVSPGFHFVPVWPGVSWVRGREEGRGEKVRNQKGSTSGWESE